MRYKFLLSVIFAVGLFMTQTLCAQVPDTDAFITTKPGAKFYPVPADQFFGSNHRETIDYTTSIRPKYMSESQNVKVIDLVNLHPSLGYDTYIVMLKKKRYYVNKADVEDNSYLEKQNRILETEYIELSENVSRNESVHAKAYYRILDKIDSLIKDNELAIRIIERSADSLELVYIKALVVNDISKARSNTDMYFKWVKTLPQDVQQAAEKFAIINQSLDPSSGGAYNYSMTFINWGPKTIKNIYWNGVVKNAQGENLTCQAKGVSSFYERFSGPVSPKTRELANWNNLIYNREAQSMVLTSIKVEYTDGTSLVLDKHTLHYVANVPVDVFDNSNQIIRSAYEGMNDSELKAPWVFELNRVEFRDNLRTELQERKDRIKQWTETKNILLREGLWSSQVEHMGIGISNSETYKEILDELRIYGNTKREKKNFEDTLLKFKRRNLLSN